MPVIPRGLSGFTIRPPCTLHDAKGEPTDDLYEDVKRVFDFIDDERHLTAHRLWNSVQKRIQERQQEMTQQQSVSSKRKAGGIFNHSQHRRTTKDKAVHFEKLDHEMQKINDLLEKQKDAIEKLQNFARIFLKTQRDLEETETWTLASTHFGVTTYYRREADGSLSIKLEGDVEGSHLFEQVCVLKEVDLHYRWSPLCTSSLKIADINKLDGVGWFVLGVPSFHVARDGCFRAIGCDNILEDGSIIISGQGINDIMPGASPPEDTYLSNDPIIQNLVIPPIPTRTGCGRMTIRKFEAVIKINSPTSVTTKLIANINPNLKLLPDSLLELVMKHAAGIALAKLQNAARKAAQNPVSNVHAVRMREEKEFYVDWLLPKFRGVCKIRGWDMPHIAAFELSQHDRHRIHQQQRMKRFRTTRAETFSAGIKDSEHPPKTIEVDESESNGFMENLSQVADDSLRMRAETESLSALSQESGKGSIWQKSNPMAVLRERDLKKKQQKEQEIADQRRKAEERIIPKELSEDDKRRLEELKKAKERRVENEKAGAKQPKSEVARTPPPKMNEFLFSFLLVMFVVILFLMLHVEPFAKQISRRLHMIESQRIQILENVAVAAYISLCAAMFYMIGVFSLNYAFESFDISRKTGRQTKMYYRKHVKKAVALLSLSMVLASLLRGLLLVGAQWILDFSSRDLNETTILLAVSDLAARASRDFETTNAFYLHAIRIVKTAMEFGAFLFLYPLQLLFPARSTKVMAGLEEPENAAFGCEELSDQDRISWNKEAFDTARAMILYPAVLLSFSCMMTVLYAKYSKSYRSQDPFSAKSPSHSTTDYIVAESDDAVNGNVDYIKSDMSSSDEEGDHDQPSDPSASRAAPRLSNGNYRPLDILAPVTPDTSPSTAENKSSTQTTPSISNNFMVRYRFRRKVSYTHSMSISQEDGPRLDSQSKACSY